MGQFRLSFTDVPVPNIRRVIDTFENDGREGRLTMFKGWEDF